MRRIHYEEEQRLSNPWILVSIVAVMMAAVLPLLQGLYWQLLKGEPWGSEPMSDQGLIRFSAFILAVCGLISWLVIAMKLHVIIDDRGVHYRFFPNEPKWSAISREEIADFHIEKKNIFNGFGYRRLWFSKTRIMNLSGSVFLSLRLKNGRRIKLGSRNPEGLAMAMNKLIPENELI